MAKCIVLTILMFLVVGCVNTELTENARIATKTNDARIKTKTNERKIIYFKKAGKWYEGGTLHKRSAYQWQVASYENKLATCADMIANLWLSKQLKNHIAMKIRTIDDLKPFAKELVVCLDTAFAPLADTKENARTFRVIEVSEGAAAGMLLMNWVK